MAAVRRRFRSGVTVDADPGRLLPLWVMRIRAVFGPMLVGRKPTVTVHDAPTARVLQPEGVAVNSVAFAKVSSIPTPVTVSGAVPVLVTVIVFAAEAVPMVTDPKATCRSHRRLWNTADRPVESDGRCSSGCVGLDFQRG